MKIIVLFGFLISITISFTQNTDNRVQQLINQLANDHALTHAAISFQAINLSSGEVVAQYNPTMSLPPASTMKLYSTAIAFELLGPFYQPKTDIYIDGEIDSNNVLNGDIWIKGGGDPTLGSKYFFDEQNKKQFLKEWSDAILSLGISRINGSVIADGSDFGYLSAPQGWTWGDLGNYYGAGPSGCVIYDNMTLLSFKTSEKLYDTTSVFCTDPYIYGMQIKNEVTTAKSQRDNAYIYGAPFSYDRFAKGTLPFNRDEFIVKASIPDPELLLAQELQATLGSRVPVKYAPKGYRSLSYNKDPIIEYNKMKKVYSTSGKTVTSIVAITNLKSINLFAEQLLCLVSFEKQGTGDIQNSASYAQSYWEKIVGTGLNISDGSGLSRKNSSSAGNFCKLLQYMHQSENFEEYFRSLPVAGKTGTLSSVCRGQVAAGKIHAKSGTMNRIKAYSGYVNSSSGKQLTFAIIINNHDCSSYQLIKKMEPLFNAMATF